MITPKTKDVWGILNKAIEAGWEDPGFTELLEITKKRALAYLQQLDEAKPE